MEGSWHWLNENYPPPHGAGYSGPSVYETYLGGAVSFKAPRLLSIPACSGGPWSVRSSSKSDALCPGHAWEGEMAYNHFPLSP